MLEYFRYRIRYNPEIVFYFKTICGERICGERVSAFYLFLAILDKVA